MASLIKKLLPLFAVVVLGMSPALAAVRTVYDFTGNVSKAKITNAMKAERLDAESGGVKRTSLFLHPNTGDARAEYTVTLPQAPKDGTLLLTFDGGVRDGIKTDDKDHPFDGVDLAVAVDGKRVWEQKDLKETGWRSGAVDLTQYAGKTITVTFISNPRENSNYDWAVFGEPRIVSLSAGFTPNDPTPGTKGFVVTSASAGFSLAPLNASGAEMSAAKTYHRDGFAAVPFDFNDLRASSVRVQTAAPDNVRVFVYDPSFQLTAFGPSRGVIFAGDKVKVRAAVKNTGEAPFTRLKPLFLQMGDDAATRRSIDSLFPGDEQTVEWDWTAPLSPQDSVLWMRAISPSGGAGITNTSAAIPVYASPGDLPAPGEKAVSQKLKDGSVVLRNHDVLLRILPRKTVVNNKGTMELPAAILYERNEKSWKRIGSLAPLGGLRLAGMENRVDTGLAEVEVTPTNAKGSAAVRVSASSKGRVFYSVALSLVDSGGIRFITTADLKKGETLRLLSGPSLLAGDGSAGARRDEAVFPGLEYLLKDDRSSGRNFAHPPFDLRLVPDPNKVTIPVMAVRDGQTLVSLTWDPLAKWDGVHDRPAAEFASPNFPSAQDNHLMKLFLPSVPTFTPENSVLGKYTAAKDTKLVLNGKINVNPRSSSVLDAVVPAAKSLAARPWTPLDTADFAAVQKMCVQSLIEPAWDADQKAWKHTNTGPVSFDPMIALSLWGYSDTTPDEGQRQNLRTLVKNAVGKARPGQLAIDLAMHVGEFERELQAAKGHVDGLIRSQRPDGSWAFRPSDEKHRVLGREGDTSSGWCAASAINVLRYARITGDAEAGRAGLKALDYLNAQIRPEGAQTWELPLHVPDILASAYATSANIEGYRITGDKHYLDKAVYWAKTGLPFVYMWNSSDRNIMRFGTIPVFGVTWYNLQPWFGTMVQWCGLAYAYELQQLAPLDKSFPWERIAEGITVSAYQQEKYITKEYPADYGMYPDAYSPVKGKEEYHWDLNPRLVAKNVWEILGQDPYADTVTVGSGNSAVTVSTVGRNLKAELSDRTLTVTVENEPETTTYLLISNVDTPTYRSAPPVLVDGLSVKLKPDLSQEGAGYKYLFDTSRLIVKVENKNPVTKVQVHF